ncbi:MAG TPA: BTAD domain-containing putative transcriptional regulator, partial [Acidimicrobiia bacterium]|nr:BTAD domain-containing putative transcriptional regulator [Acidimicrobiia bacterium]
MTAHKGLDIRVLGPPEIMVNGVAVDFDTRKALAILAYLAVEQKVSRETLTGVFWPESSSDRARATLRRTLSSIRKGAGPGAVAADRHQVRLNNVKSDIARFHAALDQTKTHGHKPSEVCDACIDPLTEAAELYRGDFLEGFMIRAAPEFEEWERITAEELRLKAGQMFDRLSRAHASEGTYAEAISAVSRWIELDPLHEPAHRLLMLLRAWSGDRPGAMAAYRDFVAILDRELAVSPLEETTELYEAILDEDLPPAPAVRRRAQTRDRAEPPSAHLINRTDEMDRLRVLLSRSRTAGLVVNLEGAPWMGKTRLVEELTAGATDHTVLPARAFRMEQGLPYGVTAQLLTTASRARLPHGIPEWALREAARITPTLASGGPAEDPDPFGELRLLDGIFQILTRMSLDNPLLISIDDVQWIDQASAVVVSYLAKRVAEYPILILTTRRNNDPVDPQIWDVISRAETIDLAPLRPNDVPGPEKKVESVIRATGGIPLLVGEHLAGRVDSAEVGRYLAMRLERISDLGKQVLSTAAVLSGSASFNLLRAVSGRSDEEVVDAVDELISGGLLREIPETETVTLALDALEKITYDTLSLSRRHLLHKRVGEALADSPHVRSEVRQAAQVASQFQRAGDPRAAKWFRLAGDLARSAYANQDALSFYETAIALGDEGIGELHLAIAELAMVGGDYQDALAELTTAAARSEGETLGRVEHRIGEVQRLMGRFDLAAEHFERAIESHPQPVEVYAD